MGKRETKATYDAVSKDQAQSKQQYSDASATNNTNIAATNSRSDESRGNSQAGYSSMLSNGGLSMGAPQRVSMNRDNLMASMPGYKDMADTGGYDSEVKGKVNGDIGSLRSMESNGGIDDASMNRMRGSGVFDEFAKTGGLSSTDQANIRSKALSPIGSYAGGMMDEMSRRRAVQGGYAPAMDSSTRALSRDTQRNIADTSLNAELGIKDQVNKGRQWGAEGAATSENAAQGLRTGNMLNAANSAGNMQMNMQRDINSNKLAGLGGVERVGQNTESMLAGNEFNNNNQQMAYDESRRSGMEGGLAGLSHIADTDNANSQAAQDRSINLLNSGSQSNQGYYGARTPLATAPGMGSNIMKGVGAAAGIGAGIMTGGASIVAAQAAKKLAGGAVQGGMNSNLLRMGSPSGMTFGAY